MSRLETGQMLAHATASSQVHGMPSHPRLWRTSFQPLASADVLSKQQQLVYVSTMRDDDGGGTKGCICCLPYRPVNSIALGKCTISLSLPDVPDPLLSFPPAFSACSTI